MPSPVVRCFAGASKRASVGVGAGGRGGKRTHPTPRGIQCDANTYLHLLPQPRRCDVLVLPEDLYQRPRGVCGQEREDGAARARVSGGAVSETRAGARRNRRFASKCVCVEGEGLRGLSLWTLSGANWWRRPPRSNRAEAAEGPRGAGGTGGQLQVHRLVEVAVSLASVPYTALLSIGARAVKVSGLFKEIGGSGRRTPVAPVCPIRSTSRSAGLGPLSLSSPPSMMRRVGKSSPVPDGIPSGKMRGPESKKGAGIGARVGGEGAQDGVFRGRGALEADGARREASENES